MENKVLATISGYEITEKDLNTIIMRYPEDRRGYFASEMGKKQLLEQLISFELMNRLGSEMKLDQTAEFKGALDQAAKDILTQMTINKVLSEVTITDDEALAYYEENKEAFNDKPSVSAKHILVDNEELALDIKNQIATGEKSFEQAAMEYSSCPSKEQGGNLGVFSRGMMVPEFEDAAFAATINEVTAPVQTQFGFHLIKVEAKNEANVKSFDEVKDQIVTTLVQQRQEAKYLAVIKELETKFDVKRA